MFGLSAADTSLSLLKCIQNCCLLSYSHTLSSTVCSCDERQSNQIFRMRVCSLIFDSHELTFLINWSVYIEIRMRKTLRMCLRICQRRDSMIKIIIISYVFAHVVCCCLLVCLSFDLFFVLFWVLIKLHISDIIFKIYVKTLKCEIV